MATMDAYHQLEYKMCAMNGVPLRETLAGSMHVFWCSNLIIVEQVDHNPDGTLRFDSNGDLETLAVEYEIIAVPHEWREFWKATATLT